jgi:hypothetical protein
VLHESHPNIYSNSMRLLILLPFLFILLATPLSAQTLPGDANGDGKVDETDYAIWRTNYNQTKTGGASIGDFNTNGKVEGLDYLIWLTNFGKTSGPSPTPGPTLPPSAEWNQLQNDAQRSGRANNALLPPYQTKWKWLNGNNWSSNTPIYKDLVTEIPVLAQPIYGDGKIYVGSSTDGKLYAINATNGNTAWTFPTEAAITHTAGYASGRVYVGSHDGFFYAINSTNGSLSWKYPTGPIDSAPLILKDRVCIGSLTGFYYCFDYAGSLKFTYETIAPIYHSSAASPDGTRIYVGPEDMTPRCLKTYPASTAGELCSGWNLTQLPGQSFIRYWPVVGQDKIIFTTLPILPAYKIFYDVDGFFNSIPETAWSQVQPKLISYYQNRLHYQTHFVLTTGGAKAYDTAASFYSYHMDAQVPPILSSPTTAQLVFRTKDSAYTGISFESQYPLDYGQMDLNTGLITGFAAPGTIRGVISRDLDDPAIYITANGYAYGLHNARCVGVLDIAAKREFVAIRRFKEDSQGWCQGTAPFFYNDTVYPEEGTSTEHPDIRGWSNRGESLMPPIIVGNSMYVVFRGGSVMAITGVMK